MHFWGRQARTGGISELEKSQGLRLRANDRENGPLAWPEAGAGERGARKERKEGITKQRGRPEGHASAFD